MAISTDGPKLRSKVRRVALKTRAADFVTVSHGYFCCSYFNRVLIEMSDPLFAVFLVYLLLLTKLANTARNVQPSSRCPLPMHGRDAR